MRICPRCEATYDPRARFCAKDASPLVEPEDMDRLTKTIGNYKLLKVIGRGGMGTVYKAEHVYIAKQVAVKILHDRWAQHDDAVKRFLREARAASSINHPTIVDVTDFGRTPDGSVYFVMEYLEGESLEDVIGRESPIPLHRAINIMNQLASALAAAHEKKIVHRDLKPENIMIVKRPGRRELVRRVLDDDGSQSFVVEPEDTADIVKILDFGIAKVFAQEGDLGSGGATVAGAIFGTPEYMSPEQARGGVVDHRADIYALGVIFYDMLTGHVPFEAETPVEILTKHLNETPRSPRAVVAGAEITDAAEALIMRALAKDPAERHQSMEEMRAELADCYGSVAYRRDAARIPGARDAGIQARQKRLTEELDEWLVQHRVELDSALERLEEIASSPPVDLASALPSGLDGRWELSSRVRLDTNRDVDNDDRPLLLTRKKRR